MWAHYTYVVLNGMAIGWLLYSSRLHSRQIEALQSEKWLDTLAIAHYAYRPMPNVAALHEVIVSKTQPCPVYPGDLRITRTVQATTGLSLGSTAFKFEMMQAVTWIPSDVDCTRQIFELLRVMGRTLDFPGDRLYLRIIDKERGERT